MPKIRGVKPDYWTDEDIVELSIPARLLFIGLWNYACDNGHLKDKPKQIKMRILPSDNENVAELLRELAAGTEPRIVRAGGWIIIPNFTKHQRPDKRYFQTCDKDGCERPAADSKPGTRGGHDEATTGAPRANTGHSQGPHVDGDGDGDGEVMVKKTRELALREAPRPDVDRLCNHLADRIEANGANRPNITGKWRDAARLMLDRDGRTEEDVHLCIKWCQADEFWRSNILSMPKLREKFDQLRMQAQRTNRPTSRQQETDALFDRAMQRARTHGGNQ